MGECLITRRGSSGDLKVIEGVTTITERGYHSGGNTSILECNTPISCTCATSTFDFSEYLTKSEIKMIAVIYKVLGKTVQRVCFFTNKGEEICNELSSFTDICKIEIFDTYIKGHFADCDNATDTILWKIFY